MDRERLMFSAEAGRWEGVPKYVKGSETYESGERDLMFAAEQIVWVMATVCLRTSSSLLYGSSNRGSQLYCFLLSV